MATFMVMNGKLQVQSGKLVTSPSRETFEDCCCEGDSWPAAGYHSVWKITSGGSYVWSYDTGDTAYATAVDSSGNVYVAGKGGVWKLNSSGVLQWTYALAGVDCWDIAVDSDGNVVVVCDEATVDGDANTSVFKLTSAGAIEWTYDLTGGQTSEMLGVATDGTDVFVTAQFYNCGDSKYYYVWKLDEDGVLQWSISDANGYSGSAVAVHSDSTISVASNPGANVSNVRFTADGTSDTEWTAAPFGSSNQAIDAAIDSGDNVYTCSYGYNGVKMVAKLDDADGSTLWTWDAAGRSASGFQTIYGVASDGTDCYACGQRIDYASIWKISSAGADVWDFDTTGTTYRPSANSTHVFVPGERVLIS